MAVSVEVEAAMYNVERLCAHRAPFEEVMAAIDACEALSESTPMYLPGIQAYRVSVLARFDRPDPEIEAAIERLGALDMSLLNQAGYVIAGCAKRPALAARFLPPLIARLEAAIAAGHDEPLDDALATARRVCEQLNVPV